VKIKRRRHNEEPANALAPWFGCKRSLAALVVPELRDPRSYWEPFCGSMAILLSKKPSICETVNDLHDDLVNLARCIQNEDTAVELYGRVARTIPCQKLFFESLEACRETEKLKLPAPAVPDVDRAVRYFTASWTGMNGVAGTRSSNSNFCMRFTSDGGSPGRRFKRAVESIPWWHDRLREVMVLNADGFELIARIEDAARTTIYCDPPYLKKSTAYRHDFTIKPNPEGASPEERKYGDHGKLAVALRRFKKTRVVLSYYDHPVLHELYPVKHWRWVKIEVTKSLGIATKDGTRSKDTEVLLINDVGQGGLFSIAA
jgi:DNA adenine methylase